jgi:hypothetical protein
MITQILTKPAAPFNLFVALLPSDASLAQPIQASSHDYGFDFNEEELAEELFAPLPAGLLLQEVPDVSAQEFETSFQCLLY